MRRLIEIVAPCFWLLLLTTFLMASDSLHHQWLIVHTSAAYVTNSARVPVKINAFSHGGPELGSPGFAFSGAGEVRIRGASSRTFAKTSYALELQDDDGEDLNAVV